MYNNTAFSQNSLSQVWWPFIVIILYYAKWQHIHIIYNIIRRNINYKIIIKPEKNEIDKIDKTLCK